MARLNNINLCGLCGSHLWRNAFQPIVGKDSKVGQVHRAGPIKVHAVAKVIAWITIFPPPLLCKPRKINEVYAIRTAKIPNRNLPEQYRVIGSLTNGPNVVKIPACEAESACCLHLGCCFTCAVGAGWLAAGLNIPETVPECCQNPYVSHEAANVLIA